MNAAADPLVTLFAEYRRQADWLNANGGDETSAVWQAVNAANLATMDQMCDTPPTPTSLAGVAAAIRYAIEEQAFIDETAEGPLKACLAFLDAKTMQ